MSAAERTRVGVVGLGAIGGALAHHLVAAGHPVIGTDLRIEACEALDRAGGRSVASPAAVLGESDVVLTSLPSPAALDAVVSGPSGLVEGAREGVIVVETGTFALADKERNRSAIEAAGMVLLDAAVSGTGAQALERDIVIMVSGDAAACGRVRPVLADCARETFAVGAFGDASRMKYLANLLVAIHNVAAAEAVALGMRAGLDGDRILEVLTSGAGTSRMLEVRGPAMVAGEFTNPGIRAETFLKDVRLIGDFARDLGCPVPLFDLAAGVHVAAVTMGHGEHDTSSVVDVVRRAAGAL